MPTLCPSPVKCQSRQELASSPPTIVISHRDGRTRRGDDGGRARQRQFVAPQPRAHVVFVGMLGAAEAEGQTIAPIAVHLTPDQDTTAIALGEAEGHRRRERRKRSIGARPS